MREGRRQMLAGIVVAALSMGGGFALWRRTRGQARQAGALRSMQLPDPMSDRVRTLGDWPGRVLVLNFWATWCEPCREEMPILLRAQAEWGAKGVQMVGIGIDSADNIRQFAKTYGITYPLATVGPEVVDVTRELGNSAGGLPYTVVLARDGTVSGSHLGALDKPQLEDLLRAALG